MTRTLIFLLLILDFTNLSHAAVPMTKVEFNAQLSSPIVRNDTDSDLRIKISDGFLLAFLDDNKLEIRKFSHSGAQNKSFGVNGEASIEFVDSAFFQPLGNQLGSIFVDEGGDIYISLLTGLEGYDVEKRQVHLFKFSSDGTADKYFGKTGWSMRLFYTHRYSLGYFVKTFITGSTNNQVLLGVSLGFGDTTFIRINQDGSIDRTFADDGMKSFASNFYISDGDKLSGSKQNHIGVRTSALKTDAGKTYHAINSVQGVWYINIDGDLLGDIDLKNYSADVFSEFEEDKFHFRTEFATDIVNGEQFVIAEVKRKNVEYDKSLMIFKLKDKAIDLTFGTKGVFWIKGDVNYFFGGNAEYAKDGGLLFTYKGENPRNTYFRYLSPAGVQTSPTQPASFNTNLYYIDNLYGQGNPVSFESFSDGRRLVYTDNQRFFMLDINGQLDNAFSQGSDLSTKSDLPLNKPYVIDGNNNIWTYRNSAIYRYNQFGKLDTNFLEGKNNYLKVEGYSVLKISWIEPNIDGGVDVFLIDKTAAYRGQQDVIILRLDENGSLDVNFGQNGLVIFTWDDNFGNIGYDTSNLKVLRTEKNETLIMVTVESPAVPSFLTLFKLDANGNFITEFGNNGVAEFKHDTSVTGLSFTPDSANNIYITGVFDEYGKYEVNSTGFIAKLNEKGQVQFDFAEEGIRLLENDVLPKSIWMIDQHQFYVIIDGGILGRPTFQLKSFDINGNATSDLVDADSFMLNMSEDMIPDKRSAYNYFSDSSGNQFNKIDNNKVEIMTSSLHGVTLHSVDFSQPIEFKKENFNLTVTEDSGNSSFLLPQVSANSSELLIINSPMSGVAMYDNNNGNWEITYRPKPNFFGEDNFSVEIKTESLVYQYLISVEIVPQEDPIFHNTRLQVLNYHSDDFEVIAGSIISINGVINTFDRLRQYNETYNFDDYTWYADDVVVASGASVLTVDESMLGKIIRFEGTFHFKEGWQKTYSISTDEPIGNVETSNSNKDKSTEKSSGALDDYLWLVLLIMLRRYAYLAKAIFARDK
ncbi:hypothetical protein KO525_10445 [Psychrosphaera sp. B3R10]|nr:MULTISPECIES: hypothetical protein [unclassified Psychrosphaera]MBU2883619.1 hypothetical protein [Psychrosphaera sp. I2R16]MBU2989797.1 hypothetical protein [Psychrosphaera sp. B3R10]